MAKAHRTAQHNSLDRISRLDHDRSKIRAGGIRDGRDQRAEEVGGDRTGRLLMQLNEGELARSVDGYEQTELALFGADLGNIDVELADRIGLEA